MTMDPEKLVDVFRAVVALAVLALALAGWILALRGL